MPCSEEAVACCDLLLAGAQCCQPLAAPGTVDFSSGTLPRDPGNWPDVRPTGEKARQELEKFQQRLRDEVREQVML